jgi:hypothetical protein
MIYKTYKTPSFVILVLNFTSFKCTVTQELCGVNRGFQFAPITTLPNFTLDPHSGVIYHLYVAKS